MTTADRALALPEHPGSRCRHHVGVRRVHSCVAGLRRLLQPVHRVSASASGGPAPVVLLAGFEVPKLDLAVLAKLMEEEAKAARVHELPSDAEPHADNRP